MGCGTSKLEDGELVLFCKERRRYMKRAVEQRYEFAAAHVAYVQALRNVAMALRNFAEGEDTTFGSFNSSSPITTFQAQKYVSSNPSASTEIRIQPASSSGVVESHGPNDNGNETLDRSPTYVAHLLRSVATPTTVFYEERLPSPENHVIQSYPVQDFAMGGFLNSHMETIPAQTSYQFGNADYLPDPPSPPSNSAWDFFNPFSSLENPYLYQTRRLSQVYDENEFSEFRRLREEEGIPELEEVGHQHETDEPKNDALKEKHVEENAAAASEETTKEVIEEPSKKENENEKQSEGKSSDQKSSKEEVGSSEPAQESNAEIPAEAPSEATAETVAEAKADVVSKEKPSKVVAENGEAVVAVIEGTEKENQVEKMEQKDQETLPENTTEPPIVASRRDDIYRIMHDLEDEFIRACEAANDVSVLLEVGRVHHSSGFTEIKEQSAKVLSSLMRSSSSRSSSFRTHSFRSQFASSSSVDNMDDSGSEFTEECGMVSGSHSSTLDRLYAWEKKLYDEVKSGERLRLAYEKKCQLLKKQVSKGEDPHVLDKTKVIIRDLHTQIKVSIQAVESISKKIQKLRDDELQLQLQELIVGLMQMWNVMHECHQRQHQIVSEAKLLNVSSAALACAGPNPKMTLKLENELHGWHVTFNALFNTQKAYVQSLNGWLSKCMTPESNASSKGRIPFSPRRAGAPPIFSICRKWCQAFDQIQEKTVVNAIRCFAVDVHELWQKQDEEQRQKKRVEHLSRDLDKRVGGLQRVESRRYERNTVLESSVSADPVLEHRKMSVESFRKHVEDERTRYYNVSKDTQNTVFKVLHKRLASTFQTLTQFAAASLKTYKDLNEIGHK